MKRCASKEDPRGKRVVVHGGKPDGHCLQSALCAFEGGSAARKFRSVRAESGPVGSEAAVSSSSAVAPWTVELRRLAHALRGEIAETGSQLTAATARMDLFRSQVLDRIEKLEETVVPEQKQTSDLNSEFEEKVRELQSNLLAVLRSHGSQIDQAHKEICQRLDTREMEMDELVVKLTADMEKVARGDVISTADLNCTRRTQSTKVRNHIVFTESLKEIVRVENSYTVRGNVWDAILLLGIEIIPMGFTGTMLMVGSILANVVTQMSICYFVVRLAFVQGAQLDEDLITEAFLWRAETSSDMVERVCDHDFSLSVNSLQAQIHELYTDYFSEWSYILCCFMLIVWTLTIVREVNMVSQLMKAILMSQRERRTTMEIHMYRIYLVSVGVVKCRLIVATCIVQFAICGLLLFAGAAWLSATETPEELLLNSVALAYVLEVDEVLYQIMCPRKIRAIIAQMQPLEYEPLDERCSQQVKMVFRICQPVAILVITLVSFFWRVNTRMGDMQRVVDALCA